MNNGTCKLTFKDISFSLNIAELEQEKSLRKDHDVIGQPRALRALKMGTDIWTRGYNIFVTGYPGTGKRTAIKKVLSEIKPQKDNFKDFIFVYNFKKPDFPLLLTLSPGEGKNFKKDIHDLIENLKYSIKARIESKSFQKKKNFLTSKTQRQENKMLAEFEGKLTKNNFQFTQIGEGEEQVMDIIPVFKGQAMDFEDLQVMVDSGELDEEILEGYMEKYVSFMDEMKNLIKNIKLLRADLEDKLEKLKQNFILPYVQAEIEIIRQKYQDVKISEYLKELETDINHNVYLFTSSEEIKDAIGNRAFVRYGVNVIVDHSETDKIPIVFENNPTISNLFGTIESRMSSRGGVKTSFMRIKAGSLIQASGGFLILQAEDILRDDNVWHRFKNALMTGQAEIIPGENSFMPSAILLKPEPVKIDVKVIIIGDPHLYDFLYAGDRDFQKLFKVAAEFDSEIDRTPENMLHYINFIKSIVHKEKLKKITPEGITAMIEYGMRIAEHRDRLSTKFSQIADLLCEADYWARKNNQKMIDNLSIQQALDEKCYLSNLPEEKYMEMIIRGEILLSVTGAETGKINALCIFDRGYYCFGRPTLITAQITPGQLGVINIERESGLSGIIHDKGVLILEGYIRSHYSQECPLSMTASICFEQSYAPIDGDSASIAELCVMLSSIAKVPLKQELAITGSVNQMGEIQPIGGVTEKVEGFYKTCKEIQLTGKQGVIIPAQNVSNLILCDEVRNAVKEDKFHIYAIRTVDEALKLLTGCDVGKRDTDGHYPKDSLNGMIEDNLRKMAEQVKAYRQT